METDKLTREFKVAWPLCFGVLGAVVFFLDCWSEICCPVRARDWMGLSAIGYSIFIVALAAQLVVGFRVFFRKDGNRSRVALAVCVGLFAALMFLLDRKTDVFYLGGLTLVEKAGGGEQLRKDALGLLDKADGPPMRIVPHAEVTGSIRALGPDVLVIADREKKRVDIKIPQRIEPATQFGFLVLSDTNETPYLLELCIFKAWKISNGVYFYEAL